MDGDKIDFFFDGRVHMSLDRTDVELAKVYLTSGYHRLKVAQEFRKSGYATHLSVAISHCAEQQLKEEKTTNKNNKK